MDIGCGFSDELVSILLAMIPCPNNSRGQDSSRTGAGFQRYTQNDGLRLTRYEKHVWECKKQLNGRLGERNLVSCLRSS